MFSPIKQKLLSGSQMYYVYLQLMLNSVKLLCTYWSERGQCRAKEEIEAYMGLV